MNRCRCVPLLVAFLVAIGGIDVYAATPRYAVELPTAATQFNTSFLALRNTSSAAAINAAINTVSGLGGGTVQLSAGTYLLDESIILKSGVELVGESRESVSLQRAATWQPTGENGILRGPGNLTDVIVRNLSIDGTHFQSELLHGIYIDDVGSGPNNRVHLDNIEVANAGGGVHIKGTSNIIIEDSTITNNGGDNYFWHNIYFRRTDHVLVQNNELTDSPTGVGIQGTSTSHFSVLNNYVAGNWWRGIRSAGDNSEYILIQGNTIENNGNTSESGDYGLGLNSESGSSPNLFNFLDNVITGNSSHGIRIAANPNGGLIAGNIYSTGTRRITTRWAGRM